MKYQPLPLKGAYLLELESFPDERGVFTKYFNKKDLAQIGHQKEIVQVNHSFNKQKGTVRGMHFQYPPEAEIKLVKCLRGEILDVIVDVRKGSPAFLKWHGERLTASDHKMMYIPEGFAHGFQTLTDDCEVMYMHSGYYSKDHEGALHYQDPAVKIDWPLPATCLSERDKNHAFIAKDFSGVPQ